MKIYLEDNETISQRIAKRHVTISVVGIGVIGLPVATYPATQGFRVYGVDKNEKRVKQVNEGSVHFEYTDLLKKIIGKGKFLATTNSKEALQESDIAIVCVPTPRERPQN